MSSSSKWARKGCLIALQMSAFIGMMFCFEVPSGLPWYQIVGAGCLLGLVLFLEKRI